MGQTLIWEAAVSARFGPQAEKQHVATPRSFGVLVRTETLCQLQKTVQARMSLYQERDYM